MSQETFDQIGKYQRDILDKLRCARSDLDACRAELRAQTASLLRTDQRVRDLVDELRARRAQEPEEPEPV